MICQASFPTIINPRGARLIPQSQAQVTKYQKIVAFFRWSDLTVQKVMFAGILSGMVGVYALHEFGLVSLHIKPTLLVANIAGGLIFGAGMLLLGF